MTFDYIPRGVCSRRFLIELDWDIIENVSIEAGCSGNLQGIAQLVKGQRVRDVIERLRGIRCGSKQTSCPDQLALALEEALSTCLMKQEQPS